MAMNRFCKALECSAWDGRNKLALGYYDQTRNINGGNGHTMCLYPFPKISRALSKINEKQNQEGNPDNSLDDIQFSSSHSQRCDNINRQFWTI